MEVFPSFDTAADNRHAEVVATMAIDFGERRIGVAVCHAESTIAFPHSTIERQSDQKAIEQLVKIAEDIDAQRLVVGEPIGVDGQRGENVERVHRFTAKLTAATGLEAIFVPETLTTVEAQERLRDQGLDPRRHPQKIDALAAQIILEEAIVRGLTVRGLRESTDHRTEASGS